MKKKRQKGVTKEKKRKAKGDNNRKKISLPRRKEKKLSTVSVFSELYIATG